MSRWKNKAETETGRLWVGTSQGLAYLNQDRFYPVELPGCDKAEISALFTDGHGMLWIGSSKGARYQTRLMRWS
jgi:ligand-binding sensor domain-containing protein